MPIFEVERYEIHSQMLRIKADTRAEAIEAIMQGGGEQVGELKFIDNCEQFGLTPDAELKEELDAAGIDLYDGHLAGIRSVNQLSKYSHQYDVKECPKCGASLTQENSVCVVFNDGRQPQNLPTVSCLDETGMLVDVFDIVENGHHIDSECNKCGFSLSNHEI